VPLDNVLIRAAVLPLLERTADREHGVWAALEVDRPVELLGQRLNELQAECGGLA
jgi:hypothetical protein